MLLQFSGCGNPGFYMFRGRCLVSLFLTSQSLRNNKSLKQLVNMIALEIIGFLHYI